MGLPNPKTRKPTASEVVEWAKSNIGKRINIDNYRGSQCWDTPNFIFKRYWGFVTWGNAKDMANYRYPKVSDSIVIHLDLYRNLETSQFGTLATE